MDFEIQKITELLNCLNQVQLKVGGDSIISSPDSKGSFSVQSCYRTITQRMTQNQQGVELPLKFIWDSQVLARIIFFLWEVNKQPLLTRFRLQQIFPEIDPKCLLWLEGNETIEHLLLACAFTKQVWDSIASGFGVQLPQHTSLIARIQFWFSHQWHTDTTSWFWSRASSSIWWSIWTYMDEVIFREHKADTQEVTDAVLLRIRFWGQSRVTKFITAEALMVDWPTTIGHLVYFLYVICIDVVD